jgi:hypothetical protein
VTLHDQLMKSWGKGWQARFALDRLREVRSFELRVGALAPNGRRIAAITKDRVFLA